MTGQDFPEISGGEGEHLSLATLLLVAGLDRVKASAAASKEQASREQVRLRPGCKDMSMCL